MGMGRDEMSYYLKVIEIPGMCNHIVWGPTERDGEESSCFRQEPLDKDDLTKHKCKFCNYWVSKVVEKEEEEE